MAASRSSLVAAMIHTSTASLRVLPSRRTWWSSITLSKVDWSGGDSRPISSRKIVPPFAAWKSPGLDCRAPVNAPRSQPNSSASIKVSGIAAQLTSMNGPRARTPARWIVAAISPLPVPVSPSRRIGGDRRAASSWRPSTRWICSRKATIRGLLPSSSATAVVTAPILLGSSYRGRARSRAGKTPEPPKPPILRRRPDEPRVRRFIASVRQSERRAWHRGCNRKSPAQHTTIETRGAHDAPRKEQRDEDLRIHVPGGAGGVGANRMARRGSDRRGQAARLLEAVHAGDVRARRATDVPEPAREAGPQPDPRPRLSVHLRPRGGVHPAVRARPRAATAPRRGLRDAGTSRVRRGGGQAHPSLPALP